jgi:hypothetical protein
MSTKFDFEHVYLIVTGIDGNKQFISTCEYLYSPLDYDNLYKPHYTFTVDTFKLAIDYLLTH